MAGGRGVKEIIGDVPCERRAYDPGMPVVGVTGPIGAGKTAFAAALEALGARRIDADALARSTVAPGTPAAAAIAAAFPGAVGADGAIDRRRLAALAFADEAAWKRLNAIVHPPVIEASRRAVAEDPAAVWVLDVPLLYESGMDRMCDLVVLVDAPAALRYARLAARGLPTAEAVRREAFLLPVEEKRRRAALAVENAGTPEDLRRAAEGAWREIGRRRP